MKSKRFTLLITLIVALFTCVCFGAVSAFAEDTTDASKYFTASEGASVKIENDQFVFTVTESGATVTSVKELSYDALDYTVSGGTVETSGNEKPGKLVFTVTLDEGVETATVNLASIKIGGKELYTIADNKVTADFTATSFGGFKFEEISDNVVWGYNYDKVSFTAYHGFDDAKIEKEAVIVYGADEADSQGIFDDYKALKEQHKYDDAAKLEGVKVYSLSSAAKIKFTDYTRADRDIRVFYGVYSEVSSTEVKTLYKELALNVKKEMTDIKAPAYDEDKLKSFFTVSGESSLYTEYMKDVEAETKKDGTWKYVGSSTYFNVPTDIYDYLSSTYFAGSDLTYDIYYKLPGSDSFTKLSSTATTKRFALSKIGDYEFYVLATDPLNNSFELDEEWKLAIKGIDANLVASATPAVADVKGFYEVNDNGTADDESDDIYTLKVPVFSFYMGNSGPQVTAGSSYQDAGFVGTVYSKVNSFTTKGSDLTTGYSLWYNTSPTATVFPDKASDRASAGWYDVTTKEGKEAAAAAVKADSDKEVDFDEMNWKESDLSFIPVVEGSYVVECTVSDAVANTAHASTEVINVARSLKVAEINNAILFLESNWVSVLFFGIALLSLIGLVVLLLVNPKEETKAE